MALLLYDCSHDQVVIHEVQGREGIFFIHVEGERKNGNKEKGSSSLLKGAGTSLVCVIAFSHWHLRYQSL